MHFSSKGDRRSSEVIFKNRKGKDFGNLVVLKIEQFTRSHCSPKKLSQAICFHSRD